MTCNRLCGLTRPKQAPEELGITEADGLLVVVNPLLTSESAVRWFMLRNLLFRGHTMDILYDADGTKYNMGVSGLLVWVDGKLAASSATLTRLDIYQG